MEIAKRTVGIFTFRPRSGSGMLVSFFEVIWLWRERTRQRRALLALDDRLLRDIGISRVEAEREAMQPFWLPRSSRDPLCGRYRD